MGRIDGQFSHNVLIYRPDPEGEVRTVEAYMEWGGISQTLDELLHHGLGRFVVLRYQDAELAALAAERGHERMNSKPPIDPGTWMPRRPNPLRWFLA